MLVFFFKQKTAYEMRISDWSSDVCSSDLTGAGNGKPATKRDGPKKSTGKKATGKKLPGWMPDAAAGGKPSRHDKQAAAKPAAGKPKAGGQGGIHAPHAAREAGRYENPIASREAILQLLDRKSVV